MSIALIESLFTAGCALGLGITLLKFPHIFTKADLNDVRNEKTKKKLNLAGKLTIVLSFLFLLSALINISGKEKTNAEFLSNIADEMNRRLPIEIDAQTTLNHVRAGNNSLIHYYKIKDIENIRNIEREKLVSDLKASTISSIKEQKKQEKNANALTFFTTFGDRNITLKFIYSDTESDFLIAFDIAPEEYK